MNPVKKTIGWADFTWNPITGCKRGCPYCYARKIYQRFNKEPFTKIVFHNERLKEPYKLKKPSKIFVGSMSDIEYWSMYAVNQIIRVCYENPQHTFMFLTKYPYGYQGFDWPENTMQGLTITGFGDRLTQSTQLAQMRYFPRPYLSIEPLIGKITAEISPKFESVIVGVETGNRKGKITPEKEWIQSIKDHVPEEKIYWKKNIREYL